MAIKKVALVGANGKLGPHVLQALLDSQFEVTVIQRSSSKSTYPHPVRIEHVPDDFPTESLVHALKGQDAIVVTTAGTMSDLQIRLADAAVHAGVTRFIPADFGSCDSAPGRALDLMPLYKAKLKVREHLQKLASTSDLTWSSIVCGHFFDYGLTTDLLGFDLKECKVRLFDDGNVKWSTTTLPTIGKAVARILQREDKTKNKMLYIQSFCVSQNQVLASLEKATGRQWEVEKVDSERFISEMKEETDKDADNAEARESLVSVVGIVEANWEGKDGFANELLDIEAENLDEVVRRVVDQQHNET